jgi:hypothetical protein
LPDWRQNDQRLHGRRELSAGLFDICGSEETFGHTLVLDTSLGHVCTAPTREGQAELVPLPCAWLVVYVAKLPIRLRLRADTMAHWD